MAKSPIKVHYLSNGIPVVYEVLSHVRSVTFKVHVGVGTRHENEKNHGVAHFLEHMLFKGTEKRTPFDIANDIERHGGMFNAYTSKEETVFYTSSIDESLFTSIDVLSDMLQNSLMNDTDIKQEKNVVIEEIKGAYDNPEDIIWDYFIEELLAPNWVGKPTLGTKKSVSKLTKTQVLDFWKTNYTAENMTIVVVGNFDEVSLIKELEHKFASFNSSKKVSHTIQPTENIFSRTYERDITQSHIVLGNRICPFNHEDKFKLILLNNILGSGMSSRMFQNIREKYGFAYNVYSSMDFYSDHGLFYSYIGTDEKHIEASIDLVKKEIGTFLKGEISDQEIDDVKCQTKGTILLGLESNSRRADLLLRQFIGYEQFYTPEEQISMFESVSKSELIEIAEKYLQPDTFSATIIKSKNM